MSSRDTDFTNCPEWPEILAALVDGELTDREREVVEACLADIPQAGKMLEAQRSLSPRNRGFWHSARPVMPSEADWDRILHAIEHRLSVPHVPPEEQERIDPPTEAPTPAMPSPMRWARLLGVVGLIGATAASITIVIWVGSVNKMPVSEIVPGDRVADREASSEKSEIFAVARHEDVELLSVADEDLDLFVVGELTLPDEMTWALAADVNLDGAEPDEDGTMPNMGTVSPNAPMMVDFRAEVPATEPTP